GSSHSLKYFSTAILEPSQGLPHFVSVGYVDGRCRVFGVYWDRNTAMTSLENLRSHYNQSEGFHIIQKMYGCELRRDGSKGGFNQYGYKGRTFLTFDKETLTWVASDPQAQITQRRWNADAGYNQYFKSYLEKECIDWMWKYLSYGNKTLLRTGPPGVTVRGKTEVEDGMEMHVCRLDGFYPREIDASWTRDGEVWEEETFHGFLAPNADGTYHYWLSIRIDPKERGHYRCHVEHDGLQEPLDLALEEPTNSKSNLGLIIIGCVVAALVLVGVIAGILVFFKKRQDHYRAAPTSDRGCNSSIQGLFSADPYVILGSLPDWPFFPPLGSRSGQSQHEERGEEMGSASF
ncbi:putative MHC class I antigen protein, partial [Naja naja]